MERDALRVMLEMRPALDGHAGIPQETRLLFRGLAGLPNVKVEGLLQSSGRVLARGLPPGGTRAPGERDIDRLSRVVISLQEDVGNPHLAGLLMALRRLAGMREALGIFDARHFRDFIWRELFARTLEVGDFEAVTQAGFRVARVPWTAMHRAGLATRHLGPLYPRLDTRGIDIMIAETPYPGVVSTGTRMVVRYHDAIPLLMPHTISDKRYHQASHFHALRCNVRRGAHFACVSDSTRNDLLSVFPEAEARAVTIHNMVSAHYYRDDSPAGRVPEILATRANREVLPADRTAMAVADQGKPLDYLLMVSTIEPRKNHATLLAAWEALRTGALAGIRLVLVGMLGWDHDRIVDKLRPWIERGELHLLEDVPSPELRLLYRHARATICPSYGEGFDFSGVEAMRCGSAVVASDIPVHREIYADAARYFMPYSSADLAQCIAAVCGADGAGERDALVARGAAVSSRYTSAALLPRWQAYLEDLRAGARHTERT